MDDTQSMDGSGDSSAWLTSRIGHAIDVLVDRQVNQPYTINDPSQAYGVDQYGRTYQLGQPAATAQPAAISPAVLLIGVVLVVLLVKAA